jgi:NADH:ubiquinone reductase (H+-translocating)
MVPPYRVVIIGGGFGGLYLARALRRTPVQITLIDRRNFHLFQPLLYQVATGGLSPGEIASPLRRVLRRQKNATVLLAEAVDIDVEGRRVILTDGTVPYDALIVATGASHAYFGNDQWAPLAPGLKTIEDALEIRRRVLLAFEAAERETDPEARRAWLNFVVVGGGPTGVELAGTLGEIAHHTLAENFRQINPADARIYLLEGTDRVLPPFPADLSAKARRQLERLGVTVCAGHLVTDIAADAVTVRHDKQVETIPTHTVIWAAGVQASPLGRALVGRAGAKLDRAGRVAVEPDLTVPGHPEIFVIGDLASFTHTPDGQPLPGQAPVAMQQGSYVARTLAERVRNLLGKTLPPATSREGATDGLTVSPALRMLPPFRYHNKGSLAAIGRAAAVADLGGKLHFSGHLAWLIWLFVHLLYIVEFENRVLVALQWAWNYFTWHRNARLITGVDRLPSLVSPSAGLAPSDEGPARAPAGEPATSAVQPERSIPLASASIAESARG